MKLTTILIGGAALVGLGVYLSKKFGAKNEEDDAVIYAGEKETYGEKFHKASMFAVGAIKTGADKIVEGFKDIKNQDMVKKGEATIDSAKEAVGDLKDKVTSFGREKAAEIEDIAEERDGFFMSEEEGM
jgi:polyhydroxyalkanoate synthesis regulator phasin